MKATLGSLLNLITMYNEKLFQKPLNQEARELYDVLEVFYQPEGDHHPLHMAFKELKQCH